MQVFKKNENKKLTRNFVSKEFECRCLKDCGNQYVSEELLNRLQSVRDEMGCPITVTSGFRCREHQEHLRGSGIKTATGISTHELGIAVDVQVAPSKMDKLYSILEKYFKSIGVARTFFHVDLRNDKEKRRWKY